MENISQKRDMSVSLVRLIATAMIVTCHIQQYLGSEWAWWFNVGVQIFLCMSGYLYGGKKSQEALPFYKRVFPKILIDYYVVVIPVLCLYFAFARDSITRSEVLSVLFAYGTINGGGHLWFIATILLCYFLTPLYGQCLDALEKRLDWGFLWTVAAMLGINVLLFDKFFYYFHPAWVNCYLVGFVCGRLNVLQRCRVKKIGWWSLVLIGTILNVCQVMINYIWKYSIPDTYQWYYLRMCDHAHGCLGVILFILMKRAGTAIFKRCNWTFLEALLRKSDSYSYDVYLVHQFLILGPFSLMAYTSHLWGNVALILVLVAVIAFGVKHLSDRLRDVAKRLIYVMTTE